MACSGCARRREQLLKAKQRVIDAVKARKQKNATTTTNIAKPRQAVI